ncbi:hypothetical protein ACFVDJ_13065 [Streptomyces rubiginosohelvolus]|uniref:DUF7639 domain-containing protein n=1 Tax=Streptomyces rubiginosohelvolus TaxID=67362 RepID=UPI0036A2C533
MTRPSERGPPALPTLPPAGKIKIRPAAVYADGLIDCVLAVPASRRRDALGDMDSKDWPLRVLVAGPGGRTCLPGDPPVSQEDHDRACMRRPCEHALSQGAPP